MYRMKEVFQRAHLKSSQSFSGEIQISYPLLVIPSNINFLISLVVSWCTLFFIEVSVEDG